LPGVLHLRPQAGDEEGRAGRLADEALAALRAEYKELDAEAVVVSLGGWPAVGHDADFLTVDTPTFCLTRCVNTSAGPVLFLAQGTDLDRRTAEPVLRAMLDSVRVDEEE
jgi:hypothetical protein